MFVLNVFSQGQAGEEAIVHEANSLQSVAGRIKHQSSSTTVVLVVMVVVTVVAYVHPYSPSIACCYHGNYVWLPW